MEVKMTRSIATIGGREVAVFTGSMKHEDLHSHTQIHHFSVDDSELGYQRKVDQGNLRNIVSAYSAGDPVFGAILLNARWYQNESVLKWRSSDGVFGILEIPDMAILYVMDGQHRIGTFSQLSHLRLEFSVVIYDGLSVIEENKAFLALNLKAKKVAKGLGQAITVQISQSPANKEQMASWIAMKLNRRQDSPWFQRLATDSAQVVKKVSKKGKRTPTKYIQSFSGMSDSISRYMLGQETVFYDLTIERKVDVLVAYWQAIQEIYPLCWQAPSEYRLTSGLGPAVMHLLLIRRIGKKVDLEVVAKEDFIRLLTPLTIQCGDEFWGVHADLRGVSGRYGVQHVVDYFCRVLDGYVESMPPFGGRAAVE